MDNFIRIDNSEKTLSNKGDILIKHGDKWNPIVKNIKIGATNYDIVDETSREEINELKRRLDELMSKPKFVKLNCMNCGAPITNRINDHILKCKYCNTAYFVGTNLVNMIE